MKIVISSSMKYREIIRETLSKLKSLGLKGVFPNLDYSKDFINTNELEKFLNCKL